MKNVKLAKSILAKIHSVDNDWDKALLLLNNKEKIFLKKYLDQEMYKIIGVSTELKGENNE